MLCVVINKRCANQEGQCYG